MEYSQNSPYAIQDLDHTINHGPTKIIKKKKKEEEEEEKGKIEEIKTPNWNFTDKIHALLGKIPFPPTFKEFNGVKVILFITFLHRLHFYSIHAFIENLSSTRMSDNDADDANENSRETASAFLAIAFLLGPLPGILADKYFGRPKVLSISFLLCFIGSCGQSLFHTLFELQLSIPGLFISRAVYYSVHVPIVIILILGSSGIAALLLPYGVDQMEEAGETKMNPYFYWFFWFVNVGSFMSFGRYLVYTSRDSFNLLSSSYLATIASFFAVVTFQFSRTFEILHRGPNIGTPLRKIFSVTKSSLRIFYFRRNEINEYESLSLLDYAKSQHYGRARFEDVEDVKTFYRIVLVLASLLGYYCLYHLQTHEYVLQAQELVQDTYPYISNLIIGLTDSLVVLVAIPIFLLLQRFPRLYFLKILYRVEFGICLALLSVICANFVSVGQYLGRRGANESCHHTQASMNMNSCPMMYVLILTILPQTVLMSLSQIFAVVGAFEFLYAQSPGDMKGFTYGILNTAYGLSIYFSEIIRAIIQQGSKCPQMNALKNMTSLLIKEECHSCAFPYEPCFFYNNKSFIYFLLVAIFAVFYALYFLCVAIKYKRRERQEIERWYCTNT